MHFCTVKLLDTSSRLLLLFYRYFNKLIGTTKFVKVFFFFLIFRKRSIFLTLKILNKNKRFQYSILNSWSPEHKIYPTVILSTESVSFSSHKISDIRTLICSALSLTSLQALFLLFLSFLILCLVLFILFFFLLSSHRFFSVSPVDHGSRLRFGPVLVDLVGFEFVIGF